MELRRSFSAALAALFALGSALAPAAARAEDTPPGPATFTAPGGVVITPGVDVIAQYAVRLFEDASGGTAWYHEIELPRGLASLSASYKAARARFAIEAVRSASEGALLGVAGDSLVMRVREAHAGADIGDALELRAGVVPTLSIAPIERAWSMRALAPSGLERTGLSSPADLGGTLRAFFPQGLGWAALGAYNGEGYARRELNRGKNIEIAMLMRPLALLPEARPLALFGSYVAGAAGTGSARANRFTAALLWEGGEPFAAPPPEIDADSSSKLPSLASPSPALGAEPPSPAPLSPARSSAARIRGGVALTYALGVDGDGERRSLLVDAFVRAEPIDRLLLGANVTAWDLDVAVPDDTLTTVTGALGYRFVGAIESYFALDRTLAGDRAKETIPGLDTWRFRLITRAVF
jgi:hypothetical protein